MIKEPNAKEQYHIYPTHGLLNDPNGLIYFNGQYHVYYQWNPRSLDHKYKTWAHVVSDDLVNWKRLPVALEPSLPEDQSGIYSGTTIEKDGELYAFYTGNVRNDAGESIASYQMAAKSTDGIIFTKLGKLFDQPTGYTRHVRDPKVFEVAGQYIMLLGAQKLDLTGDIIAYSSDDLLTWTYRGSILGNQLIDYRGYMMECPDLAFIDGQAVLMFSPQGLAPNGNRLKNIHNTGYVVGTFDAATVRFIAQTTFHELDDGFEFYASQTLNHGDEHYVIGWAGMMPAQREKTLPTRVDNWMHVLTIPRALTLRDQQLYQLPVLQLGDFKIVSATEVTGVGLWTVTDTAWSVTLGNDFKIVRQQQTVRLLRRQWDSGAWSERRVDDVDGHVKLVIDHDIVEVFINDGQHVLTARYFTS